MTGFGTVETAIEAMKKGAYDYILKPFKVEEVIHIVQRGLDRQRLQPENIRLNEALSIYRVSEAIATLAGRREDPGPGARRDHRRGRGRRRQPAARGPDEGGPLHRADAQGVGARRAQRRGAGAEPRRGAAAVPRGPPAAGERQPRLPLHRVAAARSRSPAGQLLQHPAQAEQRIIGMLNAYSFTRGNKFDEGQRKMLSVLGEPRRGVDRERAPVRGPGRREQGPRRAPTSRSRRTSSRRSSASRTRSRSRTATRAATPSASPMYARLIARRPHAARPRDRHDRARPA